MNFDESSPSFSPEAIPSRDWSGPGTPLLLGQGGDEFAAEVGDVGDHAAPDQVGNDRDPSEHVFDGRLEWDMSGFLPLAGVLTGVAREAREEAEVESRRDTANQATYGRRHTNL
jgi:hypothetical protein